MANPKYYYGKSDVKFNTDEGVYADKTGHVLEFHDARTPDPSKGGIQGAARFDGGSGMGDSSFVTFIAFLTSFSQAFSSNWSETEVYGRMDPIATFKNTTRSISVAWDIPAGNWEVAKSNLDRCNHLINLTYPTYSQQAGSVPLENMNALAMSKPPLVRMRFANLIASNDGESGLLGFITSINWNPIMDMGYYNKGTKIFPKVIQLAVEFKVLHEVNLGFDKEGKPNHGGSVANAGNGQTVPNVNWPFKK